MVGGPLGTGAKGVTIVHFLRGTALAVLLALGLVLVASGPADARSGYVSAGERSARVRQLQDRLVATGDLAPRHRSGSYDRRTSRAIAGFQHDHGLVPSGRMDRSTAALLTESARRIFTVTRVVTVRQVFRPLVIAHRGEPARAPEETIPSFQAAIDDRADVLEFDVRWTSDNAMVLLHDATLDRTTDCTGAVASKTLAEVRACDAGSGRGAEWAGTRVPTMQEVVALAKDHELRIAPELKPASVTADQVADFARVIADAGMQDSTVVQSFSAASIALYRSLESGVPVAYNTYRTSPSVAAVLATGAEYYIVDYPSITAAQVTEFQAAGIRVWLYTVTGEASDAAAKSRHPNGIITNDTVLTRTGLP